MKDKYKEKLIAFCEGLEVDNIDLLIDESPEVFRNFGKAIAEKMKSMRKVIDEAR